MDDRIFWEEVESAWKYTSEEQQLVRSTLITSPSHQLLNSTAMIVNQVIVPFLRRRFHQYADEKLVEFEEILAKQLFDLDRESVHEVLEGGDDEFLYRRGFVVGVGQEYYSMMLRSPKKCLGNMEYWPFSGISSYDFCFFIKRIYQSRHSEDSIRTTYSKETGANTEYWNYSDE